MFYSLFLYLVVAFILFYFWKVSHTQPCSGRTCCSEIRDHISLYSQDQIWFWDQFEFSFVQKKSHTKKYYYRHYHSGLSFFSSKPGCVQYLFLILCSGMSPAKTLEAICSAKGKTEMDQIPESQQYSYCPFILIFINSG